MFYTGFLPLFLAFMTSAAADTLPDGSPLSPYIEYMPGDNASSIVITAPHGGSSRPSQIQSRTVCPGQYKGCHLPDGSCLYSHVIPPGVDCQCSTSTACKVSYYSDSYTKPISLDLQQELLTLTGLRPHLIINNLQRRKMDANRDVDQATFGDAEAVRAWETFHHYIDAAKATVTSSAPNGRGLLLDVHGQSRTDNTEFGYLIWKSKLNTDDYDAGTRDLTSVCALVERNCPDVTDDACFRELIRGVGSLGERLMQATDDNGVPLQYTAIPSVNLPSGGDYQYYSGGYNTQRHGSRGCHSSTQNIDAVQVEIPKYIRFSRSKREVYAHELAQVVVDFLTAYNA